jgi:outer membrane cobalamin receptor
MSRSLIASAVSLLIPGSLLAASLPAPDLDEVTVVGSLEVTLPQELAKLGNDVAVVSEETLRDGGYVDVAQALERRVPGLYLSPTHGPFSYTDISLQGSRRNDVLWVIDGVRINYRLYSTTPPNDTIPSAMVERIEVLKDGQGLFYGTQAVAGVINIVTKGFSDTPDGRVTVGGATNESLDASGYYRGSVGPNKFIGYVSYDRSDGYEPYDVSQPSQRDPNRGYEVRTVGGKYGFDFSDDLAFAASWQHTNAAVEQIDRAYRWGHSANRREEDLLTARLDYSPEGRIQYSLKAYLHDWDTRITTTINNGNAPYTPIVANENDYWGYLDYGATALAQVSLVPSLDLLVGYDFQRYSGVDEVLLIAEQTETVHAVYAQFRTTEALSSRARFALGARYNRASEDQSTAVWNASGHVDLGAGLFAEAVVGTAFRLPDAYELYAVDPFDAAGNPNLKGEKSRNLNLSLGGESDALLSGVSWRITGFWRTVDDLIDVFDDGSDNGVFMNMDEQVRTRGYEAQVDARLSETLSANVGYTWARTRPEGSDLQLQRVPESYVKAALDYEQTDRRFGAGASVYYLGDRVHNVSGFGRVSNGNFAVIDLDAHYRFGADKKHKLNARLENLLDRDFATAATRSLVDGTSAPYVARRLGVPRTLHVSYSLDF